MKQWQRETKIILQSSFFQLNLGSNSNLNLKLTIWKTRVSLQREVRTMRTSYEQCLPTWKVGLVVVDHEHIVASLLKAARDVQHWNGLVQVHQNRIVRYALRVPLRGFSHWSRLKLHLQRKRPIL